MNKIGIIFLTIIIIIAFGGLIYFVSINDSGENSDSPGLKVSATIFPIYDIAKNIAKEKAEIKLIAPPGASPHTYEPTAEQMRQLQGSKIIFSIGHGVDDWAARIQEALPESKTITLSQGIELKEFTLSHAKEQEDEHNHQGPNPHYWLSINNSLIIAANINRELSAIDPQNAEYYQKNLADYQKQLTQAGQDIKEKLSRLETKKIITMHNAWPYFAQEFNLDIVAVFEPFPGKEPTPQYLAELSRTVQQYEVGTIFSEPQLSNQVLIPFLDDLNISLGILDPLGGIENRDSYIKMMKYNANTIYEHLK